MTVRNTRCGRVKRFAPVWSRFVLGNSHVSQPRFPAAYSCCRTRQHLVVRRRLCRLLGPAAERSHAIRRAKCFEQLGAARDWEERCAGNPCLRLDETARSDGPFC